MATAGNRLWAGVERCLRALLAVAGARAIDRVPHEDRTRLIAAYTTNLVLNAGWTAVFFRVRKPLLALVEIALLNVSNTDLDHAIAAEEQDPQILQHVPSSLLSGLLSQLASGAEPFH